MKAPPVMLWIAATLWVLAIAGNAGALFHLKWWVVLTPLWVSLAGLAVYLLLTAGVSAALEVLSWIVVHRANRRRERERRLILRGMQAGFLPAASGSRARENHVEPPPGAEKTVVVRGVSLPRPPQPDRTHGN